MQNISLKNDPQSTEEKVSCTNAQCRFMNEELMALRQQVTDLNRTVASLENTVQIKDTRLENVYRDNERLSAELKKQQRCNRNVKQQLDDERFFYQREKDYFNEEVQRQKKRCAENTSKFQQKQRKELELARDSLEQENRHLRKELSEKNETTYNLCIKFLRMKHAKDSFKQRLDQLLREHLQVMADMMEKIDEARNELNVIVSEKFHDPLPLSKAKFLQVVQRNTRLVHENAILRVRIHHLSLNIEKLRNYAQKPKLINVDAKIIGKLATQCTKKNNKEASKCPTLSSKDEEVGKSVSLTKPRVSTHLESVDHSGDAKLSCKVRPENSKKYPGIEVREVQTEDSKEFRAECVRSAPEVTGNRQNPVSGLCIDKAEYSIEHRDAFTNT